MPQENRVVVLIDMDCFYCQVEEKLNPDLKGKPIAVVQYNPWKGGGIIAVNYVARAMGVTRHMRGDEAKEKCPEIELPVVPCQRGKADITKYRDAGKEVAKVLQKYTNLLERASIDEAYLDITEAVKEKMSVTNIDTVTAAMLPNTYTLGYEELNDFITDIRNYGSDCSMDFDYENTKQLLIGALIVSEIRRSVFEETGYQCSAGIAHNKILAKLVCGMNKPNKQTILPKHCIDNLYSTLSLKKVKHLGGKFGDSVCEILKITKMCELKNFSEKELQSRFDEKNGTWLYNIAKGIDLEPVQAKFNPKSIGCCKQFRGKAALIDLDSLKKWLKDLGDEIEDRLEKDALENNRNPKQMVVSFATKVPNDRDMTSSRSYNFCAEDLSGDLFSSKSLELIMESTESGKFNEAETNRKLKAPITFLGISVGKFEDNVESKKTRKIKDYFSAGPSSDKVKEIANVHSAIKTSKKNDDKVYILQKFFKHNLSNPQIELRDNESCNNENRDNSIPVTVANCDTDGPLTESKIQSSFFASILKDKAKIENTDKKELNRPTTPNCNIVNCGEDSNDTDCSGSTINMEINRSIALFENDPENVDRMCNIRDLLKHSTEQDNRLTPENEILKYKDESAAAQELETVPCLECGKIININELDLHADYHLALKLKEEDRQQVRRDISNRTHTQTHNKIIDVKPKKKPPDAHLNKMDNVSCITSFLVKVDNNILTEECSECGKKIPVDKFSEHLDFHEAKKLSRELNKTANPSHVASSTLKRKNKSLGSAQKSKVPCKSIDSFFR